MSRFKMIVFVFSLAILFANSNPASAQEELIDRANHLQMEAQRLAELGRMDDAEALGIKAAAIFKIVEKRNQDQQAKTKQELVSKMRLLRGLETKLSENPSAEDAQHLKREIKRIADGIEARTAELKKTRHAERDRDDERARNDEHDGDDNEHEHEGDHDERHERDSDDDREHEQDEMIHRLEHMHRAMEHLHESGLHELAEQVGQRAERMERELDQREEHRAQHMMHEMMEHIESLSRQVEELRREVSRLKK